MKYYKIYYTYQDRGAAAGIVSQTVFMSESQPTPEDVLKLLGLKTPISVSRVIRISKVRYREFLNEAGLIFKERMAI